MEQVHQWPYLWGHVIQRASPCDRTLLRGIDGQAKVCQLDLFVLCQQNVLRLQVPVYDALPQPAAASAPCLLGGDPA